MHIKLLYSFSIAYQLFFIVCELAIMYEKSCLVFGWILMCLVQDLLQTADVFFFSRLMLVTDLPWGNRPDLKDRISKGGFCQSVQWLEQEA